MLDIMDLARAARNAANTSMKAFFEIEMRVVVVVRPSRPTRRLSPDFDVSGSPSCAEEL